MVYKTGAYNNISREASLPSYTISLSSSKPLYYYCLAAAAERENN